MIHHLPPKTMVVTCAPQAPQSVIKGIPHGYTWNCSTTINGKKVKVTVLFQEPDKLVVSPPIPSIGR